VSTELWRAGISHDIAVVGGSRTSKHIVRFDLPGLGSRHDGHPTLLLYNSYNGECSMQLHVGYYRFVCANGIVLGHGEQSLRIRHLDVSNAVPWQSLLMDAIYGAIADLSRHEELIARLDSTEISSWSDVSRILLDAPVPEPIRLACIRTRHPDMTGNLRIDDQPTTLWTLLNTVNETLRGQCRSAVSETDTNVKLTEYFEKQLAA
jgi:hypothetical protein